jgi:hypothetical protein
MQVKDGFGFEYIIFMERLTQRIPHDGRHIDFVGVTI